jgi:hypothetical protein
MRHRRDDTIQHQRELMTALGGQRARVRNFEWAATPLGSSNDWSPPLKWGVELVLASGFPMSIRWRPDLTMVYNDAYAGLLGDRHPDALGKPLREIWPEIYAELGPPNHAIMRGERDIFLLKIICGSSSTVATPAMCRECRRSKGKSAIIVGFRPALGR